MTDKYKYRPILSLPIAGKIFERLLYDKMFEFFVENSLMSENQSGFRPGDSCINQLYVSLMKFINLLMIALKSEFYFYVYLKQLIRFGTKVLHSNQIKAEWYIR